MSSAGPRPLWRGRALALMGIALFAFSLRVGVASLSPLLDHVARDFAVPAIAAGLIGTAPPVGYAVMGLATPLLERRFGLERLALAAAVLATVGMVARALAPDALWLLLATLTIFAAVGVGNIILPPLVKRYFPDRIGLVTTIYSTTMATATFLPPAIAVPLADAADWRFSVGLWAVFAAASALPWVGLSARATRSSRRAAIEEGVGEAADPRVFGRLWRLPLAWAMTVTFLVSSAVAYTSFAWLPQILVDTARVTPAAAGGLLSLFAVMGVPASFVVPVLVARYGRIRPLVVIAVACGLTGIAGLVFAPAAAVWLWVALLGVTPLVFPLVLVLLSLRARTHEGAVALSGFTQSVGYGIVAVFPLAIGMLHDATGSWVPALIVLAIVIAAALPSGLRVARPGTIEDDWERRHGAW